LATRRYDNYLVLAPSLETSKKLTKAIDGSVRRFSIEWKRDVDGKQRRRAFGGAAYVGIPGRRTALATLFSLGAKLEWAKETISEEPLLVTLARILGILTWDATVRLVRARGPEVTQLYRRAGWHFLNASQLGWKKIELGLEPALREEWAVVLNNQTVPFGVVNEVVTLAKDATPSPPPTWHGSSRPGRTGVSTT
jgi:hypothetical protein